MFLYIRDSLSLILLLASTSKKFILCYFLFWLFCGWLLYRTVNELRVLSWLFQSSTTVPIPSSFVIFLCCNNLTMLGLSSICNTDRSWIDILLLWLPKVLGLQVWTKDDICFCFVAINVTMMWSKDAFSKCPGHSFNICPVVDC